MTDEFEASIEDRFVFQHEVGRGAFGEVYRGEDRRTGWPVAIKRLISAQPESSALERFKLEARLLARIDSPFVVRYVAQGHDGHGRLCLALEWLEGMDLAHYRLAHAITVADAIAIVRQAAFGLDALHKAGIVHRDMKPANFFVLRNDGKHELVIKLLDLGIARVQYEPSLTVEGLRIGTPAYMSPEQARGDRELDARSDIYSLGVVLYELLAGVRPFSDPDPFALLAKIVLQDPEPLRSRAPGVWPEIEAVVTRAMAKLPHERFPNALAMADALQAAAGWTATTTLTDVLASIDASMPTSMTHTGELRVVTALFAGFDPEGDVAGDLDAFATIVTAHRGVVHRILGRRTIGVFGQSRSLGDEALCAARAALQAAQVLTGAKLAITTCRVRIEQGRNTVGLAADAIERGAALLERAREAVHIDAATARMLGGFFAFEGPEGEQVLHGEHVFDHDATPRLLGRAVGIVGRDRELAALDATYDDCTQEPAARVILVSAGPGIGKTRLAHEWLKKLRARGNAPVVLVGRGDPMRAGSPFGLLAQCVRNEAKLQDGEPLEVARRKLRDRLARTVDPDELARVAEFIGELVGVPFPDTGSVQLRAARQDAMLMGDQMRRAWEDWLAAECAKSTVLLLFEDLHWGDLPSVTYMDSALRVLVDRPLMVLALARPEVSDVFPSLWRERAFQELRLPGLSRRAAEKLVRDALGERATGETTARLCERAGGNAFYLEELIRAVAEGRRDELPETVLLMAQARLERLEPPARHALRAASVFGQVFWKGGMLALLGTGTRSFGLGVRLAELVQREVIARRAEAKFPGEEEYAFGHALLREAAYAMLTDEDRESAHRIAGEWLSRAGEREAIVLAGHFELGGEPERAIEWYLQAAQQALEGNDLATALERAERGIECGAAGEQLGRLRLVQAEAHLWHGSVHGVQQCALEALALLPRGSAHWCDAVRTLAFASSRLGTHDWLRELVEELDTLEGDAVVRPEFAAAVAHVAQTLLTMGWQKDAERLLARLESLAGALEGTHPQAAAAIGRARAEHALFRDEVGAYLKLLERVVATCEQAGDLRGACNARVAIGGGCVRVGAHTEAEKILRDAAATARRMGLHRVLARAQQHLALALAQSGQLDEARAVCAEALEAFRVQGNRRLEGETRVHLSGILAAEGKLEDAEREAREALGILAGVAPMRCFALGALSRITRQRGQLREALALSSEAVALLEAVGGVEDGAAVVRLAHAEALAATGDEGAARAVLLAASEALLRQAERLGDATLHESFLQRVPAHTRTLSMLGELR